VLTGTSATVLAVSLASQGSHRAGNARHPIRRSLAARTAAGSVRCKFGQRQYVQVGIMNPRHQFTSRRRPHILIVLVETLVVEDLRSSVP